MSESCEKRCRHRRRTRKSPHHICLKRIDDLTLRVQEHSEKISEFDRVLQIWDRRWSQYEAKIHDISEPPRQYRVLRNRLNEAFDYFINGCTIVRQEITHQIGDEVKIEK